MAAFWVIILVLKRWGGSTRLDEKSWDSAKQRFLNNVFTLFHYVEKHWLWVLKCVEKSSILIGLLSNFNKCKINILERASHKYNIYF
jgi:hypothetical protein